MRLHIRIHSSSMKCGTCNRCYLLQKALWQHLILYDVQYEFPCGTCAGVFATKSSLKLHQKGKYGEGFSCSCGQRFDSPAQ